MNRGASLVLGGALALQAMLAGAADETRFFAPQAVQRAFERGEPLHEEAAFRVVASSRASAGEAEVHRRETDVFYVLAGHAEFVTGGTLLGAHAIAADEMRGSGIEGGTVHRLEPGAVIVVPAGVPHWFRRVESPFRYFTVKPIRGELP